MKKWQIQINKTKKSQIANWGNISRRVNLVRVKTGEY